MLLTLWFTVMSSQYNLPPGLLQSLCYIESNHRVEVINYNDGDGHSYGVCQIKYKTAKYLGFKGTPEQLMEPQNNIKYAAAYLAYQMKRYKGNISKAVIAYNKGNANKLTSTRYQLKVFNRWLVTRS